MAAKHWGEIEAKNEESNGNEIPKNDKTKQVWSSFEFPPLYQPSSSHRGPKKESSKRNLLWMKPPLDSKGQSFLLQSIELQHYKRRMRYMLSAARSHQTEVQKGSNYDPPVLPSPPLPPKRFCSIDGRLVTQSQPSFLSNGYAATSSNKNRLESKHYQCPIQLDPLSTRQLMLKSAAAVSAHTGFECSTETSLNTLTDIGVEFTLKLCKLLKFRLERKQSDSTPIDIFGRVLRQYCSEDLSSLHEYWITRIKRVALKLEAEDLALLNEYNTLKDSSAKIVTKEEKN